MTKKKTPAAPAKRPPAAPAAPAPAPRAAKAKPRAVAKPAPVVVKAKPAAKPVPRKPVKKAAIKTAKKTAHTLPAAVKVLLKAEQPKDKPLTPAEERFIEEYLKDPNGTKAYMAAKPGCSEPAARVQACRLLVKPNVKTEIDKRRIVRAERLEIDGDRLVSEVYAIALADTRELVEFHVTCCRCCYGLKHDHQRTKWEMERDRESHQDKEDEREAICAMKEQAYMERPFKDRGGIGYDGRKDPNPDCPECWGRGVGRPIIRDTRKLSAGAVALYAGVKETKDGLEAMKHDKKSALDMMWKHQGLYEADNKQQSEGTKLTAEQMAAMYAGARAEAEEQKVVMQKRRKQFEADDAKAITGAR